MSNRSAHKNVCQRSSPPFGRGFLLELVNRVVNLNWLIDDLSIVGIRRIHDHKSRVRRKVPNQEGVKWINR